MHFVSSTHVWMPMGRVLRMSTRQADIDAAAIGNKILVRPHVRSVPIRVVRHTATLELYNATSYY